MGRTPERGAPESLDPTALRRPGAADELRATRRLGARRCGGRRDRGCLRRTRRFAATWSCGLRMLSAADKPAPSNDDPSRTAADPSDAIPELPGSRNRSSFSDCSPGGHEARFPRQSGRLARILEQARICARTAGGFVRGGSKAVRGPSCSAAGASLPVREPFRARSSPAPQLPAFPSSSSSAWRGPARSGKRAW